MDLKEVMLARLFFGFVISPIEKKTKGRRHEREVVD
jgi:hypothetical protein